GGDVVACAERGTHGVPRSRPATVTACHSLFFGGGRARVATDDAPHHHRWMVTRCTDAGARAFLQGTVRQRNRRSAEALDPIRGFCRLAAPLAHWRGA